MNGTVTNRSRRRPPLAHAVTLSCALAAAACSSHPIDALRDRWREPVPVSAHWERVELPESGVSFELPDNHRTETCCVLGRMATIHGEVIESPVYGLDVIRYRDGDPVNAVEISVDIVTPWMMGADRGELVDLARAPDNADVTLWLYHRVFTPRLHNLKADKPEAVAINGLRGVTFEAWRQHEKKGPRDRSRVTVISLSDESAVVIQGRFNPDATPEDHARYRRVVDSLRSTMPRVTI
ncbi:MAG: hypothetical protein V3R77_01690 [Candidatus Binatia bacterium]